jgi:hypothetical protein
MYQKIIKLFTRNIGFVSQEVGVGDFTRLCDSSRILGATYMGTPNWADSIDTPGAYSGEVHEELKVWKLSKPRNRIRKGSLGKPT